MVRARPPLIAFALLATGIYAAAVAAVRTRSAWEHPDVVRAGLLLDLLVVVPLAYWLLPVRRGGLPPRTLVTVFLLSLAGAALVLPEQRAILLRSKELLAIPLEIGLVTWIAVRVVRWARRAGKAETEDVLERLRAVGREILPLGRAADAISFEMAVLYYSLLSWRSHPRVPPAGEVFSCHRKSGYGAIVFALLIITAAEAIPLHILVSRWSPAAAWILTALSAYGMLWFVGDWRAARLRPIVLEEDTLWIRTGLRWSVRVPRAQIAAVHAKQPRGADACLRAAFPNGPALWIELAEPATAQGPYGIERQVRWIKLGVDEPRNLLTALRTL